MQRLRTIQRYSFGKIPKIMEIPNLLDLQTKSFEWFLKEGIREALYDISPIEDFTGTMAVIFEDYKFDDIIASADECKMQDMTYSAPLKVKVVFINKETGEKKEQEVFMGDFPMMTDKGTFIINGTERIVVSQLVRSPGVYYDSDIDKKTEKELFLCKVIPTRGSWIELETDKKNIAYVRIDRRRKFLLTIFLKSIGFGDSENLMSIFSPYDKSGCIKNTIEKDITETESEALIEIYKKLRPGEPPTLDSARSLIHSLFFDPKRYDMGKVGRYKTNQKFSEDIEEEKKFLESIENLKVLITEKTADDKQYDKNGNAFKDAVAKIKKQKEELLQPEMITEIEEIDKAYGSFRDCLEVLKKLDEELSAANDEDSKIISLRRFESDKGSFQIFYLSGELQKRVEDSINTMNGSVSKAGKGKIDELLKALGSVKEDIAGILKIWEMIVKANKNVYSSIAEINLKMGINSSETMIVNAKDIFRIVKYLIQLMVDVGEIDDIDHFGNRRIRNIGELVQNQVRIGLSRMERVVKERMTTQDLDMITPKSLINIRPLVASLKEFFGSGQLSQFLDQTNPLAEITHKRRLSALGPGGLSRERAGFEVRDVHSSHYGRMCPIETPGRSQYRTYRFSCHFCHLK